MTDPVSSDFAQRRKLLTNDLKATAEKLLELTGAAGFVVSGNGYIVAFGSRESVRELVNTDLPEGPK